MKPTTFKQLELFINSVLKGSFIMLAILLALTLVSKIPEQWVRLIWFIGVRLFIVALCIFIGFQLSHGFKKPNQNGQQETKEN